MKIFNKKGITENKKTRNGNLKKNKIFVIMGLTRIKLKTTNKQKTK